MAVGLLITVCSFLFAYFLWKTLNSRDRKWLSKVSGPPTLPVFGNAHMLKTGGSDFFDQVLEYSTLYESQTMFKILLGSHAIVVLIKAESVEKLLNSSSHITKSVEYRFLEPWLGTGLLTSTGAKWHSRRKLLTPTFHFRILQDFLEVFNEQSQIMVENLKKKVGGNKFDIFPYITHCALDIICDTAMGVNVDAQNDSDTQYVKDVYKISELVHRRQKAPWLWPDFLYSLLPAGRQTKECLRNLHSFTQSVIKERQRDLQASFENEETLSSTSSIEDFLRITKRKRVAFLDMLLLYQRNSNLSDEDIREEVDTFMFEGHDTTAAAANWAMHLIGSHPNVQEKIHKELDEVFDGSNRAITDEDLKKMKYLECVIKETLRLFPSVPMYGRELKEDFNIDGVDIPKTTTLLVLTSALHRDPRYFPDPEKFDPDRFTLENTVGRHPYAFVPFSAGQRNCIGQKFAMNEEKVLLASILRNFTVKAHQKYCDLRPMGELILRPENGIWVSLQNRDV
uniref:Cytochrome P450 family 4 protein n=1 Tax=Perinereis aibuhitensis TaxID=126650 RepID=I3RJK9_PERAI|nr:cytochrome P450 family 4 protein [Perinereis aibuhitensis]